MLLCGLGRNVLGWEEELKWAVSRLEGKTLTSVLLRICWSSCIYFVWQERNTRIFQNISKTTDQVLEEGKEVVRYRFFGLQRVKSNPGNRTLCRNWGLQDFIFD